MSGQFARKFKSIHVAWSISALCVINHPSYASFDTFYTLVTQTTHLGTPETLAPGSLYYPLAQLRQWMRNEPNRKLTVNESKVAAHAITHLHQQFQLCQRLTLPSETHALELRLLNELWVMATLQARMQDFLPNLNLLLKRVTDQKDHLSKLPSDVRDLISEFLHETEVFRNQRISRNERLHSAHMFDHWSKNYFEKKAEGDDQNEELEQGEVELSFPNPVAAELLAPSSSHSSPPSSSSYSDDDNISTSTEPFKALQVFSSSRQLISAINTLIDLFNLDNLRDVASLQAYRSFPRSFIEYFTDARKSGDLYNRGGRFFLLTNSVQELDPLVEARRIAAKNHLAHLFMKAPKKSPEEAIIREFYQYVSGKPLYSTLPFRNALSALNARADNGDPYANEFLALWYLFKPHTREQMFPHRGNVTLAQRYADRTAQTRDSFLRKDRGIEFHKNPGYSFRTFSSLDRIAHTLLDQAILDAQQQDDPVRELLEERVRNPYANLSDYKQLIQSYLSSGEAEKAKQLAKKVVRELNQYSYLSEGNKRILAEIAYLSGNHPLCIYLLEDRKKSLFADPEFFSKDLNVNISKALSKSYRRLGNLPQAVFWAQSNSLTTHSLLEDLSELQALNEELHTSYTPPSEETLHQRFQEASIRNEHHDNDPFLILYQASQLLQIHKLNIDEGRILAETYARIGELAEAFKWSQFVLRNTPSYSKRDTERNQNNERNLNQYLRTRNPNEIDFPQLRSRSRRKKPDHSQRGEQLKRQKISSQKSKDEGAPPPNEQ